MSLLDIAKSIKKKALTHVKTVQMDLHQSLLELIQ